MKRTIVLLLIAVVLLVVVAGTCAPKDLKFGLGPVDYLLGWGQTLKTWGELKEVASTAGDELTSGPKEIEFVSQRGKIETALKEVSNWQTAEMEVSGMTALDSRHSSIEAPEDSHQVVKTLAKWAEGAVNFFSENTRTVEFSAKVSAAVDISALLGENSEAIREIPNTNVVIIHLPHAHVTGAELIKVDAEPEDQGVFVHLSEGEKSSIDPEIVSELIAQAKDQAIAKEILTEAEENLRGQLQSLFPDLDVVVVFVASK